MKTLLSESVQIKILHIDDEEEFGQLTSDFLKRLSNGSIQVKICSDPTIAVGLVQQNKYDLIITDYRMPVLNGLELLKDIRYVDKSIPIIFFTGQSREEVAIEALNLGANRYIKKDGEPLTLFKELLHTINQIVENQKIRRAYHESLERFKIAFETSPDSVNINRLSDGVYVNINDGFTETTGFTREDVIGKSSISPEVNIWVDASDRERLVKKLRENGSVANLEAEFRKKDGTILIGLMSARIITIEGVPHILSVTRDTTDWSNLQYLSKITENIQVGVLRLQLVGDNLQLAAANNIFIRMLGYENYSEMRNAGNLFSHDSALSFIKQMKEKKEASDLPVTMVHRNGNSICFTFTGAVFEENNKTFIDGIMRV